MVIFIDRHDLFALFGGIVDEYVTPAAATVLAKAPMLSKAAVLSKAIVAKTALAGAMEGVAVAALAVVEAILAAEALRATVEAAGTSVEAVPFCEAVAPRAARAAAPAVMHMMSAVRRHVVVRGLGPRCPTECQCSCQEKRFFQESGEFSVHDFTYLW